jgi:fibronectin type 3 domain-containing protein
MSIKISPRSFFIAIGVAVGLNACAGLELSDNENEAEQFVLPAPTGVTATAVSDTKISVSWTAVPGAFKYFIFQSQAGGPFAFAGTVLAPGTSRVIINLTPNTTYSYQIVTVATDNSESAPSAPPVSATTLAGAPGAPTNVIATTVSGFQIDLSWTASPTATKYFVFQSQAGGAFTFIATVLTPETTRSVTGLTPGTMYCYQLVSSLADGSQSAPSAPPACATTGAGPVAPDGVTATAVSDTRIFVQWQPAANAAKYFIYQSQSGGAFAFRGSVLASQQTFLAVNLTPVTDYCFRVSTVFSNNAESPMSSSACDTTLTPGAGGVQAYWKLDERSGTTALDSSGFNRNGTIATATYSFDRPQIDDDRSAIAFTSSTSSAITVAPAPGLNLLGNFTVAFWAKPAAPDVTFLGMRAPGCGAPGWEIAQDGVNGLHFSGQTTLVSANTTIPVDVWSHVAVTYANATMHMFVNGVETASGSFIPDNTLQESLGIGHVAGCAGGAVLMDEVQIFSRAFSTAEVGEIGTLPPAPVNFRLTATTSTTLALAWDPVPGAERYIISKGTAAGNEVFLTHSPANPATYTGDHLTPNTQYSWTVRAVVGRLFSNASVDVVATTNPPPAAPTNLTAMVVAPDRIRLNWTAAPNAVKYYVFQSTTGAGGPFTFRGTVLSPTTTFDAVNLAAATTYTFEVQSEDAGITVGPFSAPASATTP